MLDFGKILGFDWDDGNKIKNELKHNVTQKEAEEVFTSFPLLISKSSFEDNEERWVVYGKSDTDRLLAVVFVVREERIRVISARPQSKKERKDYYETAKERIEEDPNL